MCNNFINQLFRLLFVDAPSCRAAVMLSARSPSASSTLMILDFPLPKRQSGVFTSYTKLPLPVPGCESHFPWGNLEASFFFKCGIVFVELPSPSRKHGINGALQTSVTLPPKEGDQFNSSEEGWRGRC